MDVDINHHYNRNDNVLRVIPDKANDKMCG